MKKHTFLDLSLRTGLFSTFAAITLAIASPVKAATASPKIYRFTAEAANTAASTLTLNHPSLNGKPTLRLIVGQYWTEAYNPHPVGVRYNTILKKWQIRNENGENIPLKSNFNVMITPTAKRVSVTPTNVSGILAFFPAQKGNIRANFLTTHVINPVLTLGDVPQINQVGLFYIPPAPPSVAAGRWSIYQENQESNVAAVYNVADVTNLKSSKTALSFRHITTDANSTDNETVITNALTDGKPNAVVFAQHVFTTAAPNELDESLSVRYADGKWKIILQDAEAEMPAEVEFVVTVFPAVTP